MRKITESRRAKLAALVLGSLAALAGAALLAVALWPESTAEAKSNFCTSLSNFSSTVLRYQGLDASATNDEREQAANDIDDAWSNVVDDANDWANAYDNPLTQAYDNLQWAIDWLPSDDTLAQDIDALQPELSAFPSAFRETFDGSGCATA